MPKIIGNCAYCKQEIEMELWEYNARIKNNKGRGIFCSPEHALNGRSVSEETKRKISLAQKGISVLSRGRKGHPVSEETKEKLRLRKLGNTNGQNHHLIIDKELSFRKTSKYAITKGLVPDAVFIEDGKLVALEVEHKKWETEIRKKMKMYENRNDYDKVIIVWYSPKGERLKEWIKTNGEWTLTL
jgi:hypothetical protein